VLLLKFVKINLRDGWKTGEWFEGKEYRISWTSA
jgi:hypothetical protein